jgi:poly(A)-specific ribonuclease
VNAKEKEAKDAERDAAETINLDEAMGFSKVVRHLASSGKTVVGHNMLLDLCHTVHQFIAPLPEEYHDFKVSFFGS